jgi:hypothetical protein
VLCIWVVCLDCKCRALDVQEVAYSDASSRLLDSAIHETAKPENDSSSYRELADTTRIQQEYPEARHVSHGGPSGFWLNRHQIGTCGDTLWLIASRVS